jgi:hypothetical protein
LLSLRLEQENAGAAVETNEEDLLFGIAVSHSFSDESIEVSKGGESIGASNKRID